MAQLTVLSNRTACEHTPVRTKAVLWVQAATLAWMLIECGVSLYSAVTARSVALLAFGADSFVELLSAGVVLLSALHLFRMSEERASRWAGYLLFALAVVVAALAIATLTQHAEPEASHSGIAITVAALVIMPTLAWTKRRIAKRTLNCALAADAVQSATCAWLAIITLVGLAANAIFHIRWVDPAAALAAIPVLVIEGRRALRSEHCGCCG